MILLILCLFLHVFCFSAESDTTACEANLTSAATSDEVSPIDIRPIAGPLEYVMGQLRQDFDYGSRYSMHSQGKVFWRDIAASRDNQITSMIESATLSALLEDEDDLEVFQVKGFTEEDQENFEGQVTLYSVEAAQSALTMMTDGLIASDPDIFSESVGLTLDTITTASKKVIAPCSCDLQIHLSCFRLAGKNNVRKCFNSFCSNPWTPELFAAVAYQSFSDKKRKNSVLNQLNPEDIYDAACIICGEQLNQNDSVPRKKKNA